MENLFNTSKETIEANMNGARTKGSLPFGKMVLLGILAGAFIALGAATSSTAAHGIADVGLARLVSGAVFPVGLMMIVICGGELFTGNNLMVMSALGRQIKWSQLARNLITVWLSNFAGAVIIAFLVYFSGNLNYSGGALGAYTIKIAMGKTSMGFGTAFASGILCNILVCLAVLMAGAAKEILGCFFPVCAFVVGGFEHVVANMYYIPAGLIAMMNSSYLAKAVELYGYTEAQIAGLNIGSMFMNLIPVTLGNLVGGGIFVGVAYFLIYGKKNKD